MKVLKSIMIPITEIFVQDGFNVVRGGTIASLQLDSLAKSLAANGYIEEWPITVKDMGEGFETPARYALRDGERRWRAIDKANKLREKEGLDPITEIPAQITEIDDVQWLKRMVLGNDGLNPTPLGQARAYQGWMDATGQNQTETAREFGVTAAQVSRYLKLLEVPQEVQKLIDDGKIAANTVLNDILFAKNSEGKPKFGKRPVVATLEDEEGNEYPDPVATKKAESWDRKVTNAAKQKSASQGGKKSGRGENTSTNDKPNIEPLNGEEVLVVIDLLKTHKEMDKSWIDRLLNTNMKRVKFPEKKEADDGEGSDE